MGKEGNNKLRHRISKGQNDLCKNWNDLKIKMDKLTDDIVNYNEDLKKIGFNSLKFWKRWFVKSKTKIFDSDLFNVVQKDSSKSINKFNHLIDDFNEIGKGISDFGSLINTTFELMDLKTITDIQMSKILHKFETDIKKLLESYSIINSQYEELRKETDGIILQVNEFKG